MPTRPDAPSPSRCHPRPAGGRPHRAAALAAPACLLLGLLLAGCTTPTLPPPGPAVAPGTAAPAPATAMQPAPRAPEPGAPAAIVPSPEAQAQTATLRVLQWQQRVRELGGAELTREIALREPPVNAATALELALLLAQRSLPAAGSTAGPAPANGGDLARALALTDAVARSDTPERHAARLLQARLADQRRLEEQLERQAQQLREQQRRLDQLAGQIEALRAIERSLSGARAPGAAGSAASAPAAPPVPR